MGLAVGVERLLLLNVRIWSLEEVVIGYGVRAEKGVGDGNFVGEDFGG